MKMPNEEILKYLDRYTVIAKTPDVYPYASSIEMETVTLKTRDVVAAFMGLQRQAIERAATQEKGMARRIAIRRIQNMVHFKGSR